MTAKQLIQVGFMAVVAVLGLIGSLLYGRWWQTLGLLCLMTAALLMGTPRLWLLTPRQVHGRALQGRGPRVTLASQVLFYAGLALLVSGWFLK